MTEKQEARAEKFRAKNQRRKDARGTDFGRRSARTARRHVRGMFGTAGKDTVARCTGVG